MNIVSLLTHQITRLSCDIKDVTLLTIDIITYIIVRKFN